MDIYSLKDSLITLRKIQFHIYPLEKVNNQKIKESKNYHMKNSQIGKNYNLESYKQSLQHTRIYVKISQIAITITTAYKNLCEKLSNQIRKLQKKIIYCVKIIILPHTPIKLVHRS